MRTKPTLRTILVAIVIGAVLVGSMIFIYRYQILQYSTEKIIRNFLPDYVTIGSINFRFERSEIVLKNFKILNPPGFANKYLIEIGEISCRYKMKGKAITDGFEILEPLFKNPILYIDRLPSSLTNIQEMPVFLEKKSQAAKVKKPSAPQAAVKSKTAGGSKISVGESSSAAQKGLSDVVKLPESYKVTGGKAIFTDGMVRPGPYVITFTNIEADLNLKLDSAYTKALNITTTGTGNVNGKNGETVRWDVNYNPTAPRLTMSSRFNVSGVDIMTFRPYYDRYSPLAFRSGYFSGLLIFDFDNGNIGSSDEVRLSRLSFSIKRGYENAQFLETTVPDLVKYFTSSSGDVIFDFKIKGEMSNPQFYLGPISKQAVASMAIDKISQALSEAAKQQRSTDGAKKTDVEKAAEYINMFKGLIKDK